MTTNWNQSQTSCGDAASGKGCRTYAERSKNEHAGGCCQGLSSGGDNHAPERDCAQPRPPGGKLTLLRAEDAVTALREGGMGAALVCT